MLYRLAAKFAAWFNLIVLAHDIAHRIESEMQYPGQVKVVVIRESRAVDYAK